MLSVHLLVLHSGLVHLQAGTSKFDQTEDRTSHDCFLLIVRPRIFDTIGIITQDKLSVNFRYFKAFKVSFSYSQDPDDKNVRSG